MLLGSIMSQLILCLSLLQDLESVTALAALVPFSDKEYETAVSGVHTCTISRQDDTGACLGPFLESG